MQSFITLKPVSVMKNSVGLRSAAAGYVGAAIAVLIAHRAAADHVPTLLFVTERVLPHQNIGLYSPFFYRDV